MASDGKYDMSLVILPNPQLANPLMYSPLGVLYIASSLLLNGWKVAMVDMRDMEPDVNQIPESEFVGFSCTTPEVGYARKLSKELPHGTKTIIGGAHATLLPGDCEGFDYIIQGEGEFITQWIPQKAPGVICGERILELDRLPIPAYHIIPTDRLLSKELFPGERYGKGKLGMTIICSRGCPYSCAYCGNLLRAPVIYNSPSYILAELRHLQYAYKVNYFRFEDDNITLNKDWIVEVCRMIKSLNIHWKAHTRSDLVDIDTLRIMREAGCEEMGLGVESADDGVLDLVNKKETAADHRVAVETIKKSGMRAKVYLMAGLPGETLETVELNKRFMMETQPDKWTLSRFTVYPGCDIWNEPGKYGVVITDMNFNHYWNFPNSSCHSLVDTSVEELDKRYKEFYSWLRNHT